MDDLPAEPEWNSEVRREGVGFLLVTLRWAIRGTGSDGFIHYREGILDLVLV